MPKTRVWEGSLTGRAAAVLCHDTGQGFVSKLLPKAGVLSGGMPIGGPLVGAATSLTACLFWPLAIKACWGDEMQQVLLGPEVRHADRCFLWSGDNAEIQEGGKGGAEDVWCHHAVGLLLLMVVVSGIRAS